MHSNRPHHFASRLSARAVRLLPTVAVAALLGLGAAGCGGNDPMGEYYEELADPANGLVRQTTARGLKLTMKYLPGEYMAFQERRDRPEGGAEPEAVASEGMLSSDRDYSSSIHFLLSIAPEDPDKGGDVMTRGVSSSEDLTRRAMDLNFAIREMVTAHYGGEVVPAALATMENTYGLTPKRDIVIAFPKLEGKWREGEEVDLVFDDRIFKTGINHFRFRISDLEHAPTLDR